MPSAMSPTELDGMSVDGMSVDGMGVDEMRRVVEGQREHIQCLQNDLAIAKGAVRLMKDADHHNRRLSHPVYLIVSSYVPCIDWY